MLLKNISFCFKIYMNIFNFTSANRLTFKLKVKLFKILFKNNLLNNMCNSLTVEF